MRNSRSRNAHASDCFGSDKNEIQLLTNILNAELNKLSIWFRANRLSLNLKKPNSLHLNHPKSVQIKLFNF